VRSRMTLASSSGFSRSEFNRRQGMRALTPVTVRNMTLSPLHTLVTVMWGARFEKTGDRVIKFETSYLLEKAETNGESSRTSPVAIRTPRWQKRGYCRLAQIAAGDDLPKLWGSGVQREDDGARLTCPLSSATA
jgi:hypothetical protein